MSNDINGVCTYVYVGSMVTSVGHLLGSFRKFCALLWFLHVRDQSSRCMRKLQPSLHDVSPWVYMYIHVFDDLQ